MANKEKNYDRYQWSKWADLRKLKDFVVLDIETTGLSCEKAEIIEVAIARVTGGEVQDEYSKLVNPGVKLPTRISNLTGITDDDLLSAPTLPEIAKEVADLINGKIVLGHNVTFDLAFIQTALDRLGISFSCTYLDTVQVARKAYPEMKDHKLETLICSLNLSDCQTHRALDDVHCTLKLFQGAVDKYANPLVDAITACCNPMTEYSISLKQMPLHGLRFALIGSFTFSYSDAKKLITAAGGTISTAADATLDYLVFGFMEPYEYTPEYETILTCIRNKQQTPFKVINEVALLKLCGVKFNSEVTANE